MIARAVQRIAEGLLEDVQADEITPDALRLAARRLLAQAEMLEVDCVENADG